VEGKFCDLRVDGVLRSCYRQATPSYSKDSLF
jgi:hypothetical protein